MRKHQPSQPKRKRSRRPAEEIAENLEIDAVGDSVSVTYY
jgi:hypothetical protein